MRRNSELLDLQSRPDTIDIEVRDAGAQSTARRPSGRLRRVRDQVRKFTPAIAEEIVSLMEFK